MEIETKRGAGFELSGRSFVPLARSLRLRLPGIAGGLVWNRPLGVLVEEGTRRRFVRVPDRTRQIQWLILGTGLATALLIRMTGKRARRRRIFGR